MGRGQQIPAVPCHVGEPGVTDVTQAGVSIVCSGPLDVPSRGWGCRMPPFIITWTIRKLVEIGL